MRQVATTVATNQEGGVINIDECPECHEGEEAGERFAAALKKILSLPQERVSQIRADLSPAARSKGDQLSVHDRD